MIAHRALLAAFVTRRREVTAAIVRRAYREIEAVPLHRKLPARRVGWAAAALLLGIGLVAGVPRLGTRTVVAPAERPAEAVPAAEPAAAMPAEDPTVDAAPAPTRMTRWDFERRLAAVEPLTSAREATQAVLAAWQVAPIGNELTTPDHLAQVAWRRGLDTLPLTGNLSMLRLLDLPAVLELRIPGANGPRWAALVGVDDRGALLMLDGARVSVAAMDLDRIWFGQARIVWRDFEALGPTFGPGARSAAVARLKQLLARSGAYAGPADEAFDAETERAVVEFQRSRLLVPDGRVGRLTRIVLYSAAGGYARPTLAEQGGGAS
jgi:general secretion pathway protein A